MEISMYRTGPDRAVKLTTRGTPKLDDALRGVYDGIAQVFTPAEGEVTIAQKRVAEQGLKNTTAGRRVLELTNGDQECLEHVADTVLLAMGHRPLAMQQEPYLAGAELVGALRDLTTYVRKHAPK